MPSDFRPDLSNIQAGEPSEFARKLLCEYLRQYALHSSVTQQQIADITGLAQSNVNRTLSGRYAPTLDTFLKIAGALNLRLELVEKP